jgi:hypothetical protein
MVKKQQVNDELPVVIAYNGHSEAHMKLHFLVYKTHIFAVKMISEITLQPLH